MDIRLKKKKKKMSTALIFKNFRAILSNYGLIQIKATHCSFRTSFSLSFSNLMLSCNMQLPKWNRPDRNHFLTLHHASVGRVSDGVDVRWHFMPLFAFIHVNNLLWVDGQVLVGIDDDTEETRVCLQRKIDEESRLKIWLWAQRLAQMLIS